MTTFHTSPTFVIKVKATAVRVAIVSALSLLAATALLLVVGASDPASHVTTVTDWAATSYFVILGVFLVSMSVLGFIDNANEAKKTQYDIR